MSFFRDHSRQWEIFSKSVWNRKVSWFRKNIFFRLSTLFQVYLAFIYIKKFRLKNRVTTVHLLQYKLYFFIHLRFWGRILLQIKEHPSWKASINIKKCFLICLHSSTLVYTHLVTRLHLSTFIYTRLVTCLHSSTLIYIRLHLSSDFSTLVYIRLHLSSDSAVFLEQIFLFAL